MTLEQKLNVVDTLHYTDDAGVVWRLDALARAQAEQLLHDDPRRTVADLLPCLALEPSLGVPEL